MVEIGTLLVNFEHREIRRNGTALRVSARAFDILEVLFRAKGSIVSKDDIIETVWPGQIVEENRLQVHIAALRKVLDADRELIKTVSGRGYMLVPCASRIANAPAAARRLPADTPLVGRERELASIVDQLSRATVVTLVGAGGIGKTALAVRVAHALSEERAGAVHFVELALADSSEAVLATLALALRADSPRTTRDVGTLTAALNAERTLLVLDNAEHVIDAVAEIVETLVANAAGLRILVTSREPLSIRAETVFRVDPLSIPPADAAVQTLPQHGAVELFLRRARAIAPGCACDETSIRLVADICRRLEGLPLAIELAAARVAALGVDGVAARLDDRLDLLSGGMRSALPRHQTLRATFDWSYALLDADSRTLFRCLAFFAGSFTFEAVCAVAAEPNIPVATTIASLEELAAKSLLTVQFRGAIALYRLTESTRAYAMEKLRNEGEVKRVARNHMRYLQRHIEDHSALAPRRTPAPPLEHQTLDDARSAWDWAFSDEGDPVLGVALAGSLVGTLLDASLVYECRVRAERALATLDTLPDTAVDALCEMRLCAAYAASLLLTGGSAEKASALWRRVLARAESSADETFAARALWGLWNAAMMSGDIHSALRYATRLEAHAERRETPWQKLCASATLAASLHCFGEQAQARERLERTLAALDAFGIPDAEERSLAVDPRIFGTGTLARIAWMQGDAALALRLVERAINYVRADMLEPSLCHLLAAVAVPIELACGELEAASRHLALLRSQTALNRFDGWQDYGECLAGQLDLLSGRAEAGLLRLEAALSRLASQGFGRLTAPLIGAYAQALIEHGRIDEAQTVLDQARRRGTAQGDHNFAAELLRIRGLLELARAVGHGVLPRQTGAPALESAHRYLHDAMALAREQSAPLFELRAALDLSASFVRAGEAAQALAVLEPLAAFVDRIGPRTRLPEVRRFEELLRAAGTTRTSPADRR